MTTGLVVVVGSLNVDATTRVARLPGAGETVLADSLETALGGKGLNQAVAAARLGARVRMVGRVGADPGGDLLLAALVAEGVDIANVERDLERPSGVAHIAVDPHGTNTIVVAAGANGAATLPPNAVTGAEVVLAQLEVPLATVVAALAAGRASHATTILNPAPARPLPPGLLADVDVLVPNESEAAALGALALDAVNGPRIVVVTEGDRGASVRDRTTGRTWRVDAVAPPGPVVDTTAAGDAFCGAVAAGIAAGLRLEDALARAAAAGAWAVTVAGALPSLPRAAQLG